MGAERPWFFYPIGPKDVDPEEELGFRGVFPRSEHTDPNLKQRGLATIAFFAPDDVNARKKVTGNRVSNRPRSHFVPRFAVSIERHDTALPLARRVVRLRL